MSVFTSRNTRTITIPQADGGTATIRALAPRHLEAAQQEHQRKALLALKDAKANGSDEFANVDPEAVRAYQEQVRVTPLLSYDAETLIEKGVTAWTLELPLTPENIADLDEDTRDFLADAVLQLSKPSLYRTVGEQEADRKNG